MRVVSQRRDISVDFDRKSFRRYERYIYITDLENRQDVQIAMYDTEERAKEVFNEMHDRYIDEMQNLPFVDVYYLPEG